MAHVLQHVHTCIHYTQYLLQFFPIPYYKLYLNTVYKYIITIYIPDITNVTIPKAGNKYIFYRSAGWGLLPYKLLSLFNIR